jgi:hypothetical protein
MRIGRLFVVGSFLLLSVNAVAGPKEDVAAATAKWAKR